MDNWHVLISARCVCAGRRCRLMRCRVSVCVVIDTLIVIDIIVGSVCSHWSTTCGVVNATVSTFARLRREVVTHRSQTLFIRVLAVDGQYRSCGILMYPCGGSR